MMLLRPTVLVITSFCVVIGCDSHKKSSILTDDRLIMMLGSKISRGYISNPVTQVGTVFVPASDATKDCSGMQVVHLIRSLIPFEREQETLDFTPDILVLYESGKSPTEFQIQSIGGAVRFKCCRDTQVYRCKSEAQFLDAWNTLWSHLSEENKGAEIID